MNTISIDRTAVDRVVSDLREHAASWTAVPLAERIALLERMLPKVAADDESHHRHRSLAVADLTLKLLVGRVGLEPTTGGL